MNIFADLTVFETITVAFLGAAAFNTAVFVSVIWMWATLILTDRLPSRQERSIEREASA